MCPSDVYKRKENSFRLGEGKKESLLETVALNDLWWWWAKIIYIGETGQPFRGRLSAAICWNSLRWSLNDNVWSGETRSYKLGSSTNRMPLWNGSAQQHGCIGAAHWEIHQNYIQLEQEWVINSDWMYSKSPYHWINSKGEGWDDCEDQIAQLSQFESRLGHLLHAPSAESELTYSLSAKGDWVLSSSMLFPQLLPFK